MDLSSIGSTQAPARDVPAFGVSAPASVTAPVTGSSAVMAGAIPGQPAPADKAAARTLDMQSALTQANQMLQQNSTSLEFQVDPASKQTVVKMVDITNNQVLKQFPSEEFLRMASVVDTLQKQLVNEKV